MTDKLSQEPMPLPLIDYKPPMEIVREEVLEGLKKPSKTLPSKLLYDERGSQLFDEITRLEEYYPTRTEVSILKSSIGQIVARIGRSALLIEYGSGSSEKTRLLLEKLDDLAGYVPIDISKEHLMSSATAIARAFPDLEVLPVCADYNQPFDIPSPEKPPSRRIAYFPGSTIGNFFPHEAASFLGKIADTAGDSGGVLMGVDLRKDPKILRAAYNDSKGVTADFNRNLLARLNRELDADFEIDRFRHGAVYNETEDRIEMHLVSQTDQTVHLDGTSIPFKAGETIMTETSYKYTVESFESLAAQAGLRVESVWTDPNRLFSIQYLETISADPSN